MAVNETASDVSSVVSGIRSIGGVFRNIFDAFDTIAGYLVDIGLTETQAWASIIVLIVGLFIIASKSVTKIATVLIAIVVLFILATIFGVL